MADRKQTPDILTEIMGRATQAAAQEPPSATTPTVQKPIRSSKRGSKTTTRAKENQTQVWEYRIVSFQDYKGYRPRYIDGAEFKDWMNGPLIHEYLKNMAEQGWELVTASSGQRLYGLSDTQQLYFRRARPSQ